MAIVEREDLSEVARLTLNAPERLNALSGAMLAALEGALAGIAGETGVRVVVIAAAGRAFSAGHDLREIAAAQARGDSAFTDALFARCSRVMQAIVHLPQPVIAEVQGLATAAGCQLVASCDMGLASEAARFGVNGVDVGLFCTTPAVALSRAIPRKDAFEMLATGNFIDAPRAAALGLVNRVVAAERLTGETMALAQHIAAKPPAAMRIGKRAFHAQAGLPLAEAYATAGAAMAQNLAEPDCAEGIAAFLAKRAPVWRQ